MKQSAYRIYRVSTSLCLLLCHTLIKFLLPLLYSRFDGAGYSIAQTKEILAGIASDCLVDDGYCVNAVEVFWTPSERAETLSRNDVILDFPELIDV